MASNKCVCDDSLCGVCTGWGSGLCTTCSSNTSGGGSNPCSCSSGSYSADGFTCTSCPAGCSGCTGGSYYQCSSCLTGYYFLTTMCLSSCPTGYTQDSTNKICSLSTTNALSLVFQNQIALDTLSGVTVGSSNTNKYPNWEATDPIPSIYRGYYFTADYYMTLSSLQISPYFAITIWINPSNLASGTGHVVTKYSTDNYFYLSINSSGYPSLKLILKDTSTVTLSGSTSLFSAWHNIAFTGKIDTNGKTVITLYVDGSSINSATSANASPYIDQGTLYIGRQSYSNGFVGFLWSVKIYNDNTLYNSEWKTSGCASGCTKCPSELLCPSTCAFGTFLSSGSCVSCSGCSSYGCRSTDTCRLCKYKECTACNLFDGDCTACITNASLSGGVCSCNSNTIWASATSTCELCDSLCSTCAGTYYFLCNACSGSAVLAGNVCLNACPYGFTTSPSCTSISTTVIDQTFDTDFLGAYGIFTTGTSASTYQFWNSPESLDPIPAYKRGLYFTGGQYLVSNTNIYLSNSVSMGLWVYVVTAGDILQKQSRLSLSSAGVVKATLESTSQSTISASTASLSFSGWIYLSFTIAYTSGATTITAYKNGSAGTPVSNTAYLFRDLSSDILYLGKSSTSSSFVGFIYYFSLWNTAITDFSSKISVPCGTTSSPSACLWTCSITQYYGTSSYTSCSGSSCGNLGCRRSGSCNICSDPLCAKCSGFGSNSCYLCVSHASGGSTTACSCDANYYTSADGFSCLFLCKAQCASCSGSGYYQCTACATGYYYLNGLCLTSCPTGYTQDSTNNQCTLISSTPVSLALQNYIMLDSVGGFTVGSSSSNTYPSWTDSADPVPSIYRGYYFTTSASMSMTSPIIITPFFTVTIWVKAAGSGILLLKLDGSNNMFKITFEASGQPTITLRLSDSSVVTLSGGVSLFNTWHNIAYTGDIVSGNTKIYFYTDGVLKSNQVSGTASPFADSGYLSLGMSNGSFGFIGFLWSLKIFNGNTHYNDEWITTGCPSGCSTCPSEKLCPDTCVFGSFSASGTCTTCPGSCSPHGCRSTDTCVLCKYKECTACTLFDGACTACITNASLSGGVCSCNSGKFLVSSTLTCESCDNLCSTCAGTYYFLCSACSGSAVLAGNVCLNACPYGFSTSASCTSISTTVIDQTFDTDFLGAYGIFKTSNSDTTYQFWNNPDSTDPVPAYKRGLYFSSGQFLVSNTNIYLSSSVSMGLWIYVISAGDILQKQTRLSFSSSGVVKATLENPSQSTTSATTTALSAFSGWTYLSFTITYTSGATTITAYKNGSAGTTLSNTAYIFRDAGSDYLYIGKSSSSNFSGFIYYFSLWNTAITDFSSKFSVPCGTSLVTSCLWSCTIAQYYASSSCASCSCSGLGCRRAGSCNICYDPLCSQCSGFGANLCTLCVNHASGGLTTPCSCDANYSLSADGFSCTFSCSTGCAGCSGPLYYQCTSCLASYFYLSGLCLSSCPTGYTQDSTNHLCTMSSSTAASLALEDLINLDAVSSFTVGSSNSNTYPSWTDSADPVPSINRGYYFTSASSMSLSSLKISPFYTVTMWVKPTLQGNLFLKLNGSTEMFKIVFTSSKYPAITLILQDSSTVTLSGSSDLFNSWHNIAFTGDIVSGKTKIFFYTDGSLISSQQSTNMSPFIDAGSLYLGHSNGANSFTGFLWSVKIFNENSHSLDEWKTSGCIGSCSNCPSELKCPDNCDFGSFYSSVCVTCSGSCSPYGCRSSLTCRLCLQKECKECTLFDGPCTSCIDRATLASGVCACDSNAIWVQSSQTCEYCDSLCTQCAGSYYFLCSTCIASKILVGNVCLLECPYGFGAGCSSVTSQVITQSFDQNFAGSYGIFTTAASSSLYQLFNTPETNDPIPAKSRGLYFSSGKYLESNIDVYLSYSFSLGFWAYVETAGDLFEKQNRLIINSSGAATIILESPSLATATVTTGVISSSGWSYYSITIAYSSGSTTATVYINNIAGTPSSAANYIFRDIISQTILIGKSTSSSFAGFIYNFNLWNSPITDFSSHVNNDICGTGNGSDCLWACGFGSYKDTGGSCSLCNSCSKGCVRAKSCNVCDDKLCSVCTGFGSNLCTSCVTYASGSPCSCDPGYSLSTDGFSCVICSTGCSSCNGFNYNECTACISPNYYVTNLCEPSCPTGYTQNSSTHNCDLSSSLALSLNLIDQLRLDTVSGFTVGSDSTNTYPSWDNYDPIPAIQRGYYFTGTSYMTSSLKFSPYFSLSSWVKGLNDGYFLTKYDTSVYLSISFAGGIPTLTIKLFAGTTISVSGASSIFSSWRFLSFSGEILSDGTTKIICYYNGVSVNTQISGSQSFLRDSTSGSLILGTDQAFANGFKGYVWNLHIYNDNSYAITDWVTSGCNGCSHCPADLTCLSECSLNTYPASCSPCKGTTCNYGCVRGSTCRLCKAKECLSCNSFTGACLSCISNASLSGTTCQCNPNAAYSDTSESCEPCNSACALCSIPTWAGCISCSSTRYLFENLCIGYCPTGYSKSANTCIIDSSDAYVYNLRPSQIKDEVIDLQSSIVASTGSDKSFYPNYKSTDPYAAQYRGYYFNGKSYMSITSSPKALILAPKFTISIWLNPAAASCDLFAKQSNSISVSQIFKLSLSSWNPSLKIKLNDGSTVMYTSARSLNQNQWNLLIVSSDISATPSQIISFSINSVLDVSSDLGTSWFEDMQDSFKITIGSSFLSYLTLSNYFSGFLWDLKIRNKIVDFSSLFSNSCTQCSLCPVDNSGDCIPSCKISEYWDGAQCSSCNNTCSAVGCARYDKSCNLCSNVLCSVCNDFIARSCLQCKTNAYLSSGECICNNGYFLNKTQEACTRCDANQYSINGICKNCPNKCTSCFDSSRCYTCIDRAELLNNNSCICKAGYNGTNCDEVYFDAKLSVNADNSLNLTFSQNLMNNITQNELYISVGGISLSDYSWTVEKLNSKFYNVSMNFSVEVDSKTPIIVKFINLAYFVSETNALPKNDTLEGILYHYNPYSSSQEAGAITSQTTAAVQSIVGTSLAVSFINPNPACLWSMLNTLNYISYLGLTKIPMSESLYAFIISLNGNYYLPNLFELIIDEDQGTEPYAQAKKYGYDTDLLLLNSGSALTTLGAIIASLPVIYFLSRCSHRYLARKLAGLIKNYKWSVFVRFWIQSYLDISASALIGLLNFSFGNATQGTNTLMCLGVFIFASISPALFFMFSYKNLPKIQEREKGFEKLWSSFFYEFKNDQGLMSTQYYSLFFVRRLIYIIILTQLDDYPASQVIISTGLSVVSVIYLIRYRPYEEFILQIANTITEILIMIFMGLISANLFDLSSSMHNQFELALFAIAIGIMVVQSVSSVAIFGKTCYELIKEGIRRNSPNKDNDKLNGKNSRKVAHLDVSPANSAEMNNIIENNWFPEEEIQNTSDLPNEDHAKLSRKNSKKVANLDDIIPTSPTEMNRIIESIKLPEITEEDLE
ncbi:unnamed protein product [Blepharisma stoltei]|uniref:Laminin G domain-containing protein n=1 Tax=Blepharisma stoltei TaxID=1481888 RepID=A0AAU9JYK8_9CILI|nr:unnamed protein product [Blepharisma stoltei]